MASENDTPESHYGQSLAAADRARRAEEIRNMNTAIDAAQVAAQTGATPRVESPERAALRELVEAAEIALTCTSEALKPPRPYWYEDLYEAMTRAEAVLKGGE